MSPFQILHIFLWLSLSLMASANDFYLIPHASHSINVTPGQAIHVKGRKILHVEDKGNKIKVTARDLGTATVTVGARIHRFYIIEKAKTEFLKALHTKLKSFLGLTAEFQDGEIILTGRLHRLSDWQDIAELAGEFESSYKIRAKFDSEVKQEARRWLADKLQHAGLTLPQILFEPQVKALIPEDQKNLSSLWDQLLSPLGIIRSYEKSQLAVEPLIRVRIVVAEINKKLQSQIGIEWPDMISATLAPKFSGPTSLEIFLKAMEQKGLGQILASPNLLARSGSEADFLAGGEFAIKIVTSRTKEVVWKRHGIYLKIKPRADRSGHLSVELSTEVSLVDASQAIDGVPALKINRMSTHFDLSQARTIVLSGLIRTDWGQSQNGLRGLANLPLIGGLFRSENFYNNKSELVIFVTPEILNDQEQNTSELLPKGWVKHD